jgi:hypothetical protein
MNCGASTGWRSDVDVSEHICGWNVFIEGGANFAYRFACLRSTEGICVSAANRKHAVRQRWLQYSVNFHQGPNPIAKVESCSLYKEHHHCCRSQDTPNNSIPVPELGLPEGGCFDFVQPIEKRYKDLGGQVTYKANVEKIIVENDRAVISP